MSDLNSISQDLDRLQNAVFELTEVLRDLTEAILTFKKPAPMTPASAPPTKDASEQASEIAVAHKCPLCDGPMKARQRRDNGDWFLGCAAYPDCHGTRNLNGKSTTRPGAKTLPKSKKQSPEPHAEFDEPVGGPEEDDVPF